MRESRRPESLTVEVDTIFRSDISRHQLVFGDKGLRGRLVEMAVTKPGRL